MYRADGNVDEGTIAFEMQKKLEKNISINLKKKYTKSLALYDQ